MPRANLSQDVVITAAADLADREGLHAVTLSALARHFGVAPASLYSHVTDRNAVLDGVQLLALGELADLVAAAIAGRSGYDALVALADAERGYARQFPGRWTALPRRPTASMASSPQATRMSSLVLAVLRGYEIAEDELVHATRMVSACVDGFLALEGAGGFEARNPSIDVSWQRCLTALDSVLRSWSTSSGRQP